MIETPVETHAARPPRSLKCRLTQFRYPRHAGRIRPAQTGVFADSDSNTFRERRFFRLPCNGPASGAAPIRSGDDVATES